MNKILLTVIPLAMAISASAQQGAVLTAKDYERAEGMTTSGGLNQLVEANVGIRPNWMADDRFWYRAPATEGGQFMIFNPAKGTKAVAFDHAKLAAALSTATGKSYTAATLPFQTISFAADGKGVIFTADAKQYKFDGGKVVSDTTHIQATAGGGVGRGGRGGGGGRGGRGGGGGNPNEALSPDGKKAALIKNFNLFVRDVATNKETQLTTDGIKDDGYATDNAGWAKTDHPLLIWSPDSKKIATFQQDERNVSNMYLVGTKVGAPVLTAWKYPFPGDKVVPMLQRVIIDVDNPKVIKLKVAPDPHRSTLSDDIKGGAGWADVYWSEDSKKLVFASTNRDHKEEKVRMADAETGDVRELFQETVKTQFESGWAGINWRYLSKTNEILWFSERDNWGHLYLYDATTGQLKNQIDKGDWVQARLDKVDEKNRVIYFMADGMDPENPYFGKLCKVGFDGKNFTVLTPGPGNHAATFSPSGNYIIDTYQKPDVPPVTVLRNMQGKQLMELSHSDISKLTATGWKPVIPFSVKAHDGKTDIYGLLWLPKNLQAGKKYPIIDYIYPGPQGGSVGSWNFSVVKGDNNALTELGFIVVEIEGTSNPYRSKSFHDMSYGNMADNTLSDQVSGIQQLANKYPIDLDKVGIWGHSGGGFATAGAMFRYPDFFKVGIAESGNHENRNYEDNWGERYDGLVENDNYDAQANQNLAKNLKGHLMLAHGLMDNNVPPQNTLLVVDALEKANKDYDLVIFPNDPHGYRGADATYMMRRRWDYFVRYLLGATPPKEFQLGTRGGGAPPAAGDGQ